MIGLDLGAAYWDGRQRYPTAAATLRGDPRPCTVTTRAGVSRRYPNGKAAARDWPTGNLTRRRGGYFERATRRVTRPPREAPLRMDPRYWSEQEALIAEMYVDLRPQG